MAVRVNHNRRASPVHGCYDTIVSRGNQATRERRAHVPHSIAYKHGARLLLIFGKGKRCGGSRLQLATRKAFVLLVLSTFSWRVGAGEVDLGQVESFNQFAEI